MNSAREQRRLRHTRPQGSSLKCQIRQRIADMSHSEKAKPQPNKHETKKRQQEEEQQQQQRMAAHNKHDNKPVAAAAAAHCAPTDPLSL